jgi:hypothetical protein
MAKRRHRAPATTRSAESDSLLFRFIANGELAPDEDGMIPPNMEAARREASRSLVDLARDTVRSGSPCLPANDPKATISGRAYEPRVSVI